MFFMSFFYLEHFISAFLIFIYFKLFQGVSSLSQNPIISLLIFYPVFILVYLSGFQRSIIRAFVFKISSKDKKLKYFYDLASFYIYGDKPYLLIESMKKHNLKIEDISNILYKKRERIDLENWESIAEFSYIYYGSVQNAQLWQLEKQYPKMQDLFVKMHQNLEYIIEDHKFDTFIQK